MSESSPGVIRRLFSWIWQLITWVRLAIVNLIFLAIIAVIVFSLLPSEPVKMPQKTALRIAPSGLLVDQLSHTDPLSQILDKDNEKQTETLVRDLTKAINAAANDDRITMLVLELDYLIGGGLSKLEEIGQALNRFKDSGKPVIAISDSYTQEQYYLASYADEIHMHPMGAVMLTGYGSYRNYFKSALEKLSVNFHVFRVGEYKDFIEPYTRDNMSEASREHNAQWLHELWGVYTSRIENLRGLPAGSINSYISSIDKSLEDENGNAAQLALKAGLVDFVDGRLATNQKLIEKAGQDVKRKRYKAIDYAAYLHHIKQPDPQADKIGLLVAKGTILDGEQPQGNIGGDSLAKLLRQARKDADIKALVIRIDSGGGSAFASEIIREEIAATQSAGIPVIISMGSVAASGGYWITTASDEVWATPTTITGSIGVFGIFPTLENSLEKLGVYTDGLGTTELAGAMRLDRPLPSKAENMIQQSVENIYQRFIHLVAEARDSTPEQIHAVAQGRVWSGAAAKDLGLVDELGYLDDAIQSAADIAGTSNYEVKIIEKALSPKEQLLKELMTGTAAFQASNLWQSQSLTILRELIAPVAEPLKIMNQLNDPRYIYAQCWSCTAP